MSKGRVIKKVVINFKDGLPIEDFEKLKEELKEEIPELSEADFRELENLKQELKEFDLKDFEIHFKELEEELKNFEFDFDDITSLEDLTGCKKWL